MLVIGTVTVFEFAGIVTDGGTVATAVLSELRATTNGTGVTADKFSVTFCVVKPRIPTVCGEKPSVAVTWTAWTDVVYPVADAVMFALPTLTPVTCGCVAGAVWPVEIVTVDGDMLTFEPSLLDRVTVTADGAGAGSVTANCVV